MHLVAPVVFSLIAPGSGQAYNGRMEKAYILGAIGLLIPAVLLPLVLRAYMNGGSPLGMAALSVVYLAVIIAALVDSVKDANRINRGELTAEGGGIEVGAVFLITILVIQFLIRYFGLPQLIYGR